MLCNAERVSTFLGCVQQSGVRTGFGSDRRVVAQEGGHRVTLRETDQSHSMKDHAMTSAHDIDLHQFLTDRLADASPDLLRSLLSTFIDALMGAEADSLCGAGFGERSSGPHQQPERLPPPGLRHPRRNP